MTGLGDPLLERLAEWGRRAPDVRAIILESSRAIAGAQVDAFSDYDVVLVVDDVTSRTDDRSWVEDFGEVLVRYWDPVTTDAETGGVASGNIVQYLDGLKIDFSLWSRAEFVARATGRADESSFDAGYLVLLDEEGLTACIPSPTGKRFVPSPPDAAQFAHVVANFLVGVPYIAKCLLRGDLLPARWVLDEDMRFGSLVPMLWWSVECEHDWDLPTRQLGRGLQGLLAPEVWDEVTATFACGTVEATWEATFTMLSLFGKVTSDVASGLGFEYPAEQFDRSKITPAGCARGSLGRRWRSLVEGRSESRVEIPLERQQSVEDHTDSISRKR